MSSINLDVSLEVELPGKGSKPMELEVAVWREGNRAARLLFADAIRAFDEQQIRRAGFAKQRLERRWITTLFGRLTYERYRVRTDGGTTHLLDEFLGIGKTGCSAGIQELARAFPSETSLRRMSQLLHFLVGEPISHQTVRRLLLGAQGNRDSGGRVPPGAKAGTRGKQENG